MFGFDIQMSAFEPRMSGFQAFRPLILEIVGSGITSRSQRKSLRPFRILVHNGADLIDRDTIFLHFQNDLIVDVAYNIQTRLLQTPHGLRQQITRRSLSNVLYQLSRVCLASAPLVGSVQPLIGDRHPAKAVRLELRLDVGKLPS